jgi:hypothetical protein
MAVVGTQCEYYGRAGNVSARQSLCGCGEYNNEIANSNRSRIRCVQYGGLVDAAKASMIVVGMARRVAGIRASRLVGDIGMAFWSRVTAGLYGGTVEIINFNDVVVNEARGRWLGALGLVVVSLKPGVAFKITPNCMAVSRCERL